MFVLQFLWNSFGALLNAFVTQPLLLLAGFFDGFFWQTFLADFFGGLFSGSNFVVSRM
jgi:hypothetical protein